MRIKIGQRLFLVTFLFLNCLTATNAVHTFRWESKNKKNCDISRLFLFYSIEWVRQRERGRVTLQPPVIQKKKIILFYILKIHVDSMRSKKSEKCLIQKQSFASLFFWIYARRHNIHFLLFFATADVADAVCRCLFFFEGRK